MATLEEVLASVTTLLARYSAALSVDGGSKLLTLDRTGTGDTAAVVLQQGGAERFRMGQIAADTFALQRSPSGAAVDYTDVLSVNRSTGAVTISGSLSASVSGASGSFTALSAGSVGIGTSVPEDLLHVRTGASGVSGSLGGVDGVIIEAGPSRTAGLVFYTPADRSAVISFADPASFAAGQIGYQHAVDALYFIAAGAEAMRIDSAGRVGIGTSTPGALLEVNAGSFNTRFTGNGVVFSRDGPNYIDALAGSSSILYRAAASHQMHVGGVEIARFGPAGLGIGKNATLALDVAGAGRFVQAVSGAVAHSNYDNLIVENNSNAGITILTPNNSIGGLVFKDPENATIGDGGMYYEHSLDRLSVGTFSVGYVRLVAGGVEGMRLLGTGQVLIGTTAAGASKLRISGLPTSSAGLAAGDIWNDGGTLKVA